MRFLNLLLGVNMRYMLRRISFFILLAVSFTHADIARSDTMFSEVSLSAGTARVTPTFGAGWRDVNNDGLEDLYSTNHQYLLDYQNIEIPPDLFINNGNGTFTPMAAQYGLLITGDLHGPVWGDFNNDGLADLYQTGGGGGGQNLHGTDNRLFKNLGSSFLDIAVSAGVARTGDRGRGAFWLDFNNDSLLDLFVCNDRRQNHPSELLTNNGNETFVSAGVISIIGAYAGGPVDFNNDNILDILLLHAKDLILYKGNRNGTFTDVTAASGLSLTENAQGFAWGDYDNDGDMDLFVTSAMLTDSFEWDMGGILFRTSVGGGMEKGIDFTTLGNTATFDIYNYLWRVDPPSIFIGAGGIHPASVPFTLNVADPAVLGKPVYTPGAATSFYAWLDVDGWHLRGTTVSTDRNDYFSGYAYSNGAITNATTLNFDFYATTYTNKLFENMGNGTFVEMAAAAGIADISDSASYNVTPVMADFDNDSWLDIYIVNTGGIKNTPDKLYMNNGNRTFTEKAALSGIIDTAAGKGENVVTADYDNNGFLDLYVMNGQGPAPFSFGPTQLYRNNGNGNHWLKIKLVGKVSNRDSIGATVTAQAGGMSYLRQQNGEPGRFSQNSQVIHFGLGASALVDTLTIEWPSGVTQILTGVNADQTLVINEPSVSINMVPSAGSFPAGGTVSYQMTIANETNQTLVFDLWTNVTLPNGSKYPSAGEFLMRKVTLAPNSSSVQTISHPVPLVIRPGNYIYNAFVGRYKTVWNQGSFAFSLF